MDKFIIIEIGSTNTKAYLYENDKRFLEQF